MKRTIFISVLALIGTVAYSQSYSDFFTTYKDVSTPSTQQSNGITQYEVIDVDKLIQSISPQNVRTVNGVYIHNGQLYSVKLKVGDNPNRRNELIGCGYWDGHSWQNTTFYPSSIGIGVAIPEQIRLACAYKAYISSLGTVYF